MGAVGFMIDAVLGQLDESNGDAVTIGGIGVTDHIAEGRARLIRTIDDLLKIEEGDIIVAPSTGESFNSMLHLVAGIVTDHGSHACHAAIVAREMGFPAVVGTVDATRRIADGDRIRLDGSKGEIVVL
jgi:pyruvate,water dikinase